MERLTPTPRNNEDGNREIFLIDYAQRRIFQITNTKNVLNPREPDPDSHSEPQSQSEPQPFSFRFPDAGSDANAHAVPDAG